MCTSCCYRTQSFPKREIQHGPTFLLHTTYLCQFIVYFFSQESTSTTKYFSARLLVVQPFYVLRQLLQIHLMQASAWPILVVLGVLSCVLSYSVLNRSIDHWEASLRLREVSSTSSPQMWVVQIFEFLFRPRMVSTNNAIAWSKSSFAVTCCHWPQFCDHRACVSLRMKNQHGQELVYLGGRIGTDTGCAVSVLYVCCMCAVSVL